ncbi:MAG: hypothetical protein J5871_01240 [Bacteroidales bacterium]|nr:hypothetical protein [Bacteroidales bacterium]
MKLNKIFKWGMVALIVVSVLLVIIGFSKGFEANDGRITDLLLIWACVMIGIALFSWVVIGLIISIQNDPRSLVKMGILLVGAAALCCVAYLLAPGAPAFGREGLDDAGTLKLTDTLLNLTYICGGAAILSIVVGEIRMAITNKK